jgi:hypothetical protein
MIDQLLTTETIATIGFPIVVTFYLLFYFRKSLDKNTKAIENLTIFLNGKNKQR